MKEHFYRSSFVLAWDTCAHMAYLQYVQGYRPNAGKATLAFGVAIHKAVECVIKNDAFCLDIDPVKAFEASFRNALKGALTFPTSHSPTSMLEMGRQLSSQLTDSWQASHLMPMWDDQDELLVERRFVASVAKGVTMTGTIDALCLSGDYQRTVLPDTKTCAQPHTEQFAHLSDQLTHYQVLITENRLTVDEIGFWDMLKRLPKTGKGKKPEVLPPKTYPARSKAQLQRYVEKLTWIDEDVRKGRFPRRSLSSYSSPCNDCSYFNLCHHEDDSLFTRGQERIDIHLV